GDTAGNPHRSTWLVAAESNNGAVCRTGIDVGIFETDYRRRSRNHLQQLDMPRGNISDSEAPQGLCRTNGNAAADRRKARRTEKGGKACAGFGTKKSWIILAVPNRCHGE